MNKFEVITTRQFRKDFGESEKYKNTTREDIKLPARATKYSAGYDFYAPFDITLAPGETITIPTGIRAILEPTSFLALFPRSGLGFKYRLQLDNTVGIIDADYSNSSNEGHIWAKITNDGHSGKTLFIPKGDGFMQGVILTYGLIDNDTANGVRDGGFGSTSCEAK